MKASEVLRAAAEKIATPEKWTRCALARDSDGHRQTGYAGARAPESVCWCLEGALLAASPPDPDDDTDVDGEAFDRAFEYVQLSTGDEKLHVWNDRDGRTHQEVLAALTKAAELAESEGQ
jgi:hypothetical protein